MFKCYYGVTFLLSLMFCGDVNCMLDQETVLALVENWSKEISEKLYKLSETMTRKRKMTASFRSLEDKIYYEEANSLIENTARDLREAMEKKKEAVMNIAHYAEYLAFHRKTDYLAPNGTFRFYDAANITNTTYDVERVEILNDEIRDAECDWWCYQKDLGPLEGTNFFRDKLFNSRNRSGELLRCDCDDLPNRQTKSEEHYNSLPLTYNPKFDSEVNLNLSVVKIATNIYERDQDVLQGIRWSEALDLVFTYNLEIDPTLKYQYFASPYGYMRHFPAVQWPSDPYDVTFDPRTRSWYTEAMTSPKDIVILLDISGSMEGEKRILSTHIVNNILDTLNDNDYVNIYTFTNATGPLVACFSDTLVPANEENLRLLRESLNVYRNRYAANITVGFQKAFELLADFRERKAGAQCNQAIMLITEGIDYPYEKPVFNTSSPVRIFTYLLYTNAEDSKIMESIACSNRGYFANVSVMQEIREKVLSYINVMSRPINCNYFNVQKPVWSYVYIDLADRRYSNWLWRKYEGNRQREVFLDHAKREFMKQKQILTSENHMLLQETHRYEIYEKFREFDYMTTISLPVFGRRKEDIELIGVAGIDVPIKFLKTLIPHHMFDATHNTPDLKNNCILGCIKEIVRSWYLQLGVNAYAFLVTNNGYILMHPEHRPEFDNIPKPTFNRVDLLEVEILDDSSEPRLFDKSIVELRENITQLKKGYGVLQVKFAVDDMKRIILTKRRYYYTAVGEFSLGIALPDKYGLMVVNNTGISYEFARNVFEPGSWSVHPDWVYCKDIEGETPEEIIRKCLIKRRQCKNVSSIDLFGSLFSDANDTFWFDNRVNGEDRYVKEFQIENIFVATHSGLTRWKYYQKPKTEDDEEEEKEPTFPWKKAIDEDWYKRTVEENFDDKNENIFIYSVPFEISGFEDNTMVTSTSTIFVKADGKKTPVAVVGLQFNHQAMYRLYKRITGQHHQRNEISCQSNLMNCFILDNNGYVVLSDGAEHTGRFIGDLMPNIMYHLEKNDVYKPVRMFDYQSICQKPPPPPRKKNSASSIAFNFRKVFENLLQITDWALATILFLITTVMGEADYKSNKPETLAYERLEINKTVPTPCDQEMYLFTLNEKFHPTPATIHHCSWSYVVKKIPGSNLLFLVVNPLCVISETYEKWPTPTEIDYTKKLPEYHLNLAGYDVKLSDYNNAQLPCYIAINSNFSRRTNMPCYNFADTENGLNERNRFFCGHIWK